MIEITEKNMQDILYHLDDCLAMFGYGSEYVKVANTVKSLPLTGVDLRNFPYIRKILGR